MKFLRSIAAIMAGAAMISASSAVAQDKVVLRLSSATVDGSTFAQGQEKFRDEVARLTDGRVEVQIFNNAQLGSGRESLELAKLGSVDFVVTGAAHASGFAPEFNAIVFPYVWKDRKTMFDALDGGIGQQLSDALGPNNLSVAAYWDNGFRNISNNVLPVVKPEDVKGLKLRTLPSSVHVTFFKALGAEPTPMDWKEVIPALQQGVLDGQENPPAVVYPYKVYEVQKYYSLTGHVNEPMIVVMSDLTADKVGDDMAAIKEAMTTATEYQRSINAAANADYLEKLRGLMEVNDVPEETLDAFRKIAKEVNERAAADLGPNGAALLDTIYAANQ